MDKKNNKNKLIVGVSCIAVLVVLLLLLIFEGNGSHKVTVKNNTDRDIEHIYVSVADDELFDLYFLCKGGVPAGKSLTEEYRDDMIFEYENPGQLYCEITFKGGDTIKFWDGSFTNSFTGKIDLNFTQSSDNYYLTVDAGTGLFGSGKNVMLDNLKVQVYPDLGYAVYNEE